MMLPNSLFRYRPIEEDPAKEAEVEVVLMIIIEIIEDMIMIIDMKKMKKIIIQIIIYLVMKKME